MAHLVSTHRFVPEYESGSCIRELLRELRGSQLSSSASHVCHKSQF